MHSCGNEKDMVQYGFVSSAFPRFSVFLFGLRQVSNPWIHLFRPFIDSGSNWSKLGLLLLLCQSGLVQPQNLELICKTFTSHDTFSNHWVIASTIMIIFFLIIFSLWNVKFVLIRSKMSCHQMATLCPKRWSVENYLKLKKNVTLLPFLFEKETVAINKS